MTAKTRLQKFNCIILAGFLILSSLLAPQPAQATDCADVEFVFARGSGEQLGDISVSAWESAIRDELSNSSFSYRFYELGSDPDSEYSYPAVPVADSLGGVMNLLGAYIGRGNWFNFGRSVRTGVKELKSHIAAVSASCPRTKFVLGGYSQGAMLMMSALDILDASKILYVATFGDPRLYLPEGNPFSFGIIPRVPEACSGASSEYREYVPDCWAYQGVLGGLVPYYLSSYQGKVGTWCNGDDILCSSGTSVDDHVGYVSGNLYRDAARVIARHFSSFSPADSAAPVSSHLLDQVVFVIDGTGSMMDQLARYRDQLRTLGSKIIATGGEVAVVVYRDCYQNEWPAITTNFTKSASQLNTALNITAIGGGLSKAESALLGLTHAFNNLDWRQGATKSAILISDDAYWVYEYDGTSADDVINLSKKIDPINIYPLVSEKDRDAYNILAEGTSGAVFDLDGDELDLLGELILSRPEARLNLSSYEGYVGQTFTFDASDSFSLDNSELSFIWDLDGDGEFEPEHTDSVIHYSYADQFSDYIQVKITDSAGQSSTASAKVEVHAADYVPDLPNITDLSFELVASNIAKVEFASTAPAAFLSIDDAPIGIIETIAGEGEFTLADLSGTTEVVLTPFNDVTKGISRSVSIAVAESNSDSDGEADNNSGSDSSADFNSNSSPNSSPNSSSNSTDNSSSNSSNSSNNSASSSINNQIPTVNTYSPSAGGSTILTDTTITIADSAPEVVPEAPAAGTISRLSGAEMPMIAVFAFIYAQLWCAVIILRH